MFFDPISIKKEFLSLSTPEGEEDTLKIATDPFSFLLVFWYKPLIEAKTEVVAAVKLLLKLCVAVVVAVVVVGARGSGSARGVAWGKRRRRRRRRSGALRARRRARARAGLVESRPGPGTKWPSRLLLLLTGREDAAAAAAAALLRRVCVKEGREEKDGAGREEIGPAMVGCV